MLHDVITQMVYCGNEKFRISFLHATILVDINSKTVTSRKKKTLALCPVELLLGGAKSASVAQLQLDYSAPSASNRAAILYLCSPMHMCSFSINLGFS